MPAKYIFHNAVRKALEKEEWVITHDPFYLEFGGVEMYIDLGAQKLIAAEKESQKIAVEIKSFLAGSAISEFHTALGQFLTDSVREIPERARAKFEGTLRAPGRGKARAGSLVVEVD